MDSRNSEYVPLDPTVGIGLGIEVTDVDIASAKRQIFSLHGDIIVTGGNILTLT